MHTDTCIYMHTHTHTHTQIHTLQQPLGSQWQDITWLVYNYRCWQQKISMMDSVCGWQRSLMTSSPSTCCSHPSSSPMNLPWVSRLDSNVPMVVSHRYGGPFISDSINCRNKIKIGGWGSEWGCCIVCQCIHHTFCPLGVCVCDEMCISVEFCMHPRCYEMGCINNLLLSILL